MSYVISVFLILLSMQSLAQEEEQAANLKAVFIYNFTKYLEWPGRNEGDFIIGIVGNSEISKPLRQIAETRTVSGHRIVLKTGVVPQDLPYCHILIIPSNSPYRLEDILQNVPQNTVTVGESPGYARMGTALNLLIVDNKLKFEANVNALNRNGVKASSQLLKLATIVD